MLCKQKPKIAVFKLAVKKLCYSDLTYIMIGKRDLISNLSPNYRFDNFQSYDSIFRTF
jgi:hypothetical protein